uniref:Uncharacterized protein n=1 Tax=Romanomermis culicivorax TaxID=13658 RepID=A0A915HKR6_ROMCU
MELYVPRTFIQVEARVSGDLQKVKAHLYLPFSTEWNGMQSTECNRTKGKFSFGLLEKTQTDRNSTYVNNSSTAQQKGNFFVMTAYESRRKLELERSREKKFVDKNVLTFTLVKMDATSLIDSSAIDF